MAELLRRGQEVPASAGEVGRNAVACKGAPNAARVPAADLLESAEFPEASTDNPLLSTDGSLLSTSVPLPYTGGSLLSTDTPYISTDAPLTSTDFPLLSTDSPLASTDNPLPYTEGSEKDKNPVISLENGKSI